MKKLTSLLLVVVMLFALVLSSCGAEVGFDYKNEDLTPYVTLANYLANKLQVDVGLLADKVTEEEINEAIDDLLVSAKAVYKKIEAKDTPCAMGDTVGIRYKGVKVSSLQAAGYAEDGTGLTAEQIKGVPAFQGGEATDAQDLQLGSGAYIDGFEEGLAGHKVGEENIPLKLQFPKDYTNKDLQGVDVVFFVTIDYKLQTVDPRDLAFKDQIYVTYEAVLDEEDNMYAEDAKDLLTEEKVTKLLTLSQDDQFHSALIIAFNKMAADNRLGVEFTFSEERNIVVTVEKPIEGEGTEGEGTEGDASTPAEQDDATTGDQTEGEGNKTDITKEDRQVTVHYTVTVHNLCNTRYFTHVEAEKGEELKWEDFCKKTNVSKDEFADYAAYKADLAKDMQLQRDIQKKADLYNGAFDALVAKSEVNLDSEEMQALVVGYFNEIKENIDYMEVQVQTDDNLYYNYYLYTLYYGQVTVRNYVLQSYGYTEKDLDITNKSSKLMTDAEEYVTKRLVFWQFVKDEGIELTDEDYHEGYEEYKKLYQFDATEHEGHDHDAEDLLGHLGITEEQLREALLWDKAAKLLAEKYCEISEVPVKES